VLFLNETRVRTSFEAVSLSASTIVHRALTPKKLGGEGHCPPAPPQRGAQIAESCGCPSEVLPGEKKCIKSFRAYENGAR
jgi:hypothetical protein